MLGQNENNRLQKLKAAGELVTIKERDGHTRIGRIHVYDDEVILLDGDAPSGKKTRYMIYRQAISEIFTSSDIGDFSGKQESKGISGDGSTSDNDDGWGSK